MIKKTCAAFLSLSLSLFAALTPAVSAGEFAAEPAPVRLIAAPSVSLSALPGSVSAPQAPSLSAPELSPEAGVVPAAADAAQSLAEPGAVSAFSPVAVAVPAAASEAAKTVAPSAAPSAQTTLTRVGAALSADAHGAESALGAVFENSRHGDCDGSCGSLTERVDGGPAQATLQPAAVRPEADRPSDGGVPQQPKSSFKRSLKVGFVGAIAMLAVNVVVSVVAQGLGYHFHPGYHDPVPAHPSLIGALLFLPILSVFAPVAEEILFRAGLMKMFKGFTFNKSDFIIPAIASSLLFVAAHEMQDPVLFGVRFVGAMILARVYYKEGIAASMSTHGIYNGLPYVAALAAMLLGPVIGTTLGVAITIGSIILAIRFHNQLKADAPARKAGRIVPFEISRAGALGLAFLLSLGFLFLIHTPVWIAGLIGWLVYAAVHKKAAKN